MNTPDPHELAIWLEWASARLIAMPGPRAGPADYSGYWPDFSQDSLELTDFRARIALRVAAPGPHEIGLMEEILALPNLLVPSDSPQVQAMRKAIRYRSLIHPITSRHLYNWTRLSKKLETSRFKAQRFYELGLIQLSNQIAPSTYNSIKGRFESDIEIA